MSHAERYKQRRASGGCTYCTNQPAVIGKTMCQECLDKKKNYRLKQIARGKCFGHPQRDTLRGRKICSTCLWRSISYKTGWTEKDYVEAYKKQKGRCAICSTPGRRVMTANKTEVLQCDHCHKSKTRRGLLCTSCNTLLGRFADDPKRIRLFADKVEAYFRSVQKIA